MVKLCHEKVLILKCMLPPPKKKMNLLQKISNTLTRKSTNWNNVNPLKKP